MTDQPQFNHRVSIEVRFADIDALGHVNNAVYLSYLEMGRLGYAQEVFGWNGQLTSIAFILAHVEVDFSAPIFFGDSVTLHTRCSRIGTKSLDLAHRFVARQADAEEREVARALTTLVTYDFGAARSVPVPDEWRTRIAAYEPTLPG